MEINPLIPVGAKIKVEKSKIENSLQDKSLKDLPQIINGEVIDYKMTDGMDIGYVLITENNRKIWVFNNELNEETKNEHSIDSTKTLENIKSKEIIIEKYKINYEIDGNRKIKTIFNPINIFSWLIYTLKDIF